MGGYGSGRQGGRPTADSSRRIDLAWMMRQKMAVAGADLRGTINWTCRGSPSGSIAYVAYMAEPDNERLELIYTRGSGADAEHVRQNILLEYSVPHYGGKRWWMVCPFRHVRCGKLYLPPGGDRFASRMAWRLGYETQRQSACDRQFERLFRLQAKLGCEQGWGNCPRRPKGMWRRTYERHFERFLELDRQCSFEMQLMERRLAGRLG